MTVVGSERVNNHMNNPQWSLGVINVPDNLPKVTLYSHVKATHDFNKMDRDIYQGQSKFSPLSDKKTPTSLWFFLGLGGVFGVYKLIKCALKK